MLSGTLVHVVLMSHNRDLNAFALGRGAPGLGASTKSALGAPQSTTSSMEINI